MCWHKWTKWEQYDYEGFITSQWGKPCNPEIPFTERRQKRHCIKCNKEEIEKL